MNQAPNPEPMVSVIIPAYESQLTARATLESLRTQTLRNFETILIDSGRTDGVARIADDFPEIRYHRSARQLLPHQARNVGTELARSEILVFTDPDIIAAPDWLEKLVNAHSKFSTPLSGAVACLQSSWVETGVHFAKFDIWLPGGRHDRTVPVAASVNFLCTKDVLRRVGGFDGGEMIGDTLLSWDLTDLGQTLHFVGDAVVYHDHRCTIRQLLHERFVRGGDFGRLRSQREDWNGAWTVATIIVTALPLRLLKLVARSLGNAMGKRCGFAAWKTLPIITAGHAAWLAGEISQYWKYLQLRRTAPEAKEACM